MAREGLQEGRCGRPRRSRGPGRRHRARQRVRPARPNSPAGLREAHRSFAQVFRRLHRVPEHRARGSSRCRLPAYAVALEHGAEGRRNGDPAFGVDLVRECRDKAVHPCCLRKHLHSDPPLSHRQSPVAPTGVKRTPDAPVGRGGRSGLGPLPDPAPCHETLPGAVGHLWDDME